jgi:hypothetical protein
MSIVERARPDRSHVRTSDESVIRYLMKVSKRSREDVLAAIERVGTNINTVKKELGRAGVIAGS